MNPVTAVRSASLLLALIGALLVPAQASAEDWTITDQRDPGRHDLSAVTVKHRPKSVLIRTSTWPRINWLNVVDVWIDTRPGNPGPEFAFTWNDLWPRSLGPIDRVHRWNFSGARQRPCPRARVKWSRGKDHVIAFPRRCLAINGKLPERIRVSVHAYDEQGMAQTQDWVPGNKRFGGHWVSAG